MDISNGRRFQCIGVMVFIVGCAMVFFTSHSEMLASSLKPLPYQRPKHELSKFDQAIEPKIARESVPQKGHRISGNETSLVPHVEDSLTRDNWNQKKNVSKTEKTEHHKMHKTEEKRHIAFLKVHKAASTTLQTMFFRFGYARNLSFVFPVDGHYVSDSPNYYKTLMPPLHGDHYDIICNHAFFNYDEYSKIMPNDTIYIAVVRDPYHQFISAYHYYSNVYHMKYLTNIPGDKIRNLIYRPERYDSKLSFTMNSMARDFGFQQAHYDDNTQIAAVSYLDKLGSIFDFVLIAEHFDKSLIMMKRLLKWSLKDILYISKNVHRPQNDNASENDMRVFQKRNWLDYLVYAYFYKLFNKKMIQIGDSVQRETENFKSVLDKVQTWCQDQNSNVLNVDKTDWNEAFNVTTHDCKLMAQKELPFIQFLKNNNG